MKIFKRTFVISSAFVLLLNFCFSNAIFAQESSYQKISGLSASFQQSQLDIMIPFWLTEQTVFAPFLGGLYVEDVGSDINLGFVFRFYRNTRRVRPYIGTRLGAFISSPDGGETTLDSFAGLLYGGEFFIYPQFSIGIEAQVDLAKSDRKSTRFANPGGITLNTGAAIIANIYF